MSESEVRALVARLLQEHANVGPESGSRTHPQRRTEDPTDDRRPVAPQHAMIGIPCLTSGGREQAQRTASLLVALDELMADFQPPAPPPVPERPERCLSEVAARNDPARAREEQAHLRDAQQERRAAQVRARDMEDEVHRSRPLYYSWVRDWNGGDFVLRTAMFSCSLGYPDHGWWNGTRDRCLTNPAGGPTNNEWRVRSPEVKLSNENAELMRRLRARTDLHPEAEQFCSVQQAQIDEGDLLLTCDGPREEQSFRVRVPVALAARGAALADVGVGDLVRFAGHGVLWKTLERRAYSPETPRWEFWRFDGQRISIIERSICCAAAFAGTDAGTAPTDAANGEVEHGRGRHARSRRSEN